MKKQTTELNTLTDGELDSLLLFALYKMVGVPEYSLLGELAFLLDRRTLIKVLGYFGGTTIKIPTLLEFQTITDALLLYEYVDMEGQDFDKAFALLTQDKTLSKRDKIKKAYFTICDILKDYELKV